MVFFLGTTLASLILVVIGFVRRGEPGAMAMLAGGLIYVAGMFLCTILLNVPLNNALAAVIRRVRSRTDLGALSKGVDLLESCADDFVRLSAHVRL